MPPWAAITLAVLLAIAIAAMIINGIGINKLFDQTRELNIRVCVLQHQLDHDHSIAECLR